MKAKEKIEALKNKMQKNNVTQSELSEITGLDQAHISRILSGKKIPTLTTFSTMENGVDKLII